MPGFPGAQKMSVTPGACASFHTSACSRPPEPTTRILIWPVSEFNLRAA